jgi:large subunit ribosomal protein L10
MVAKKYKNKPALVSELHEKLGRASAVVVTEYRGLKAGDLVKLRSSARESQIEILIVKNTLLKRAAEGTTAEAIAGDLSGPTAVAIAYGEPTEAAKKLADNVKTYDPFNLKNGVVEKMVVDAGGLAALAKMPGREEMQSQFAGSLEGFIGEFAGLVESIMQEFAGLVEARAEQLAA